MGMSHYERTKARRQREQEAALTQEAEERLLLEQYLRRRTIEAEIKRERDLEAMKAYLKRRSG